MFYLYEAVIYDNELKVQINAIFKLINIDFQLSMDLITFFQLSEYGIVHLED